MNTQLIPSPRVIMQQTKEGVCLLHTTRGECHILNPVAAFIWDCLERRDEDITPESLAQQVSAKYKVPYETALSDINTFITEAITAGIIVTSEEEINA